MTPATYDSAKDVSTHVLPIPIFETLVCTHRPPRSHSGSEFHYYGIIYQR